MPWNVGSRDWGSNDDLQTFGDLAKLLRQARQAVAFAAAPDILLLGEYLLEEHLGAV